MGESTKNPKESIPLEARSYDTRIVLTFDESGSFEGDLKKKNRRAREWRELEAKICEHEKTGKPIGKHEAVALVERIKSLTPHFDGRPDYIAFLAGECLTLQEGQAAGEVFVFIEAELKAAREFRIWRRAVALAIPVELRFPGPDSTFGVLSDSWLHRRYTAVVGEFTRRVCPPGSPGSRNPNPLIPAFEPVRPGAAVPVVPAPVEDTTREYIERARPKFPCYLGPGSRVTH